MVVLPPPFGPKSPTFATGPFGVIGPPFAITYHYGGDTNFNALADGTGTLTIRDTTPRVFTLRPRSSDR